MATRLDCADLTGAILTGTYIEKWGATKRTKIDRVECSYVYMKLPTSGQRDPNRMPPVSHGDFKIGEFQKFAGSLIDTLDLYHSKSFDPRAVVIALRELAEEFEGDFSIVALESKGDGQVVVKVQVPDNVDYARTKAEYYPKYEKITELLPAGKTVPLQFASLVDAIDSVSNSMEHESSAVKIRINAETAYVGISEKGDVAMTDNRVSFSNSGQITNTGSGAFNFGQISGTVANVIGEIPDSLDPDKPGLKELLSQLKDVIEQDTELSTEDKNDLLKQVQVIAGARNVSNKEERNGLIRQVTKVFSATFNGLSKTATIVNACDKLFPKIVEIMNSIL